MGKIAGLIVKTSILATTLLMVKIVMASDAPPKLENQPHFEDGKDYFSYSTPITLEPRKDKKLRIQFFFDYNCDVCSVAQDTLELYSQMNPHRIVFEKLPVATEDNTFSAYTYYSLKALQREDLADLFLFETAQQNVVMSLDSLRDWLLDHGITETKFAYVTSTSEIARQSSEAIALTEKYGVFTVPFVVIDGKYVLTKTTLYNDDYTFAVLDYLVDKVEKEKRVIN